MSSSQQIIALLVAGLMSACGGSSGQDPYAGATFVFRLRGQPSTEEFRVISSSPEFIAMARAELGLPLARRRRFVQGVVAAGKGSNSPAWRWHLRDVSMVEIAIELCDGTPSMVEQNLDYWLNTVKVFCPWSSYVYAELVPL